MTSDEMRLTGVWASIVEARKKLMDAQNEIAQVLAVLEAMDEAPDEVANG